MKLESNYVGEKKVVTLLDITEINIYNGRRLMDAIRAEIKEGDKKIGLDLSKIKYLDSSALGNIIGLKKDLDKRGIEFEISDFNSTLAKIISLSSLDKLISIPGFGQDKS